MWKGSRCWAKLHFHPGFQAAATAQKTQGSSPSLRFEQGVPSLQAAAQRPANTGVQRDNAPTLAVNTKSLIGDNEMKRIFGASVLAEEARGALPPPLPTPPRSSFRIENTAAKAVEYASSCQIRYTSRKLPDKRHTRLASNHHAMHAHTHCQHVWCAGRRGCPWEAAVGRAWSRSPAAEAGHPGDAQAPLAALRRRPVHGRHPRPRRARVRVRLLWQLQRRAADLRGRPGARNRTSARWRTPRSTHVRKRTLRFARVGRASVDCLRCQGSRSRTVLICLWQGRR